MNINKLATLILSVLMVSACAAQSDQIAKTKSETSTMTEPTQPAISENTISATGTIRYQDIEGGFWGIIGDDGIKYDPMELDSQFQKEGLRVSFKASPETDMMSTHMWGTIINLSHIEIIK